MKGKCSEDNVPGQQSPRDMQNMCMARARARLYSQGLVCRRSLLAACPKSSPRSHQADGRFAGQRIIVNTEQHSLCQHKITWLLFLAVIKRETTC